VELNEQFSNSFNPNSTTQICVVHQIRNASKYVVWKNKKEFAKDMKEPRTLRNQEAYLRRSFFPISSKFFKF